MEGIVIKSFPYKEKSKIVHLYTPNGMVSVKALDVAQKKLGFVTTLNYVNFDMSKSKIPTVLEYSIVESFYSLYEDLNKIAIISPMLDVISSLDEEAPHMRIFPFMVKCIRLLKNTNNPKYVLTIFLTKMLSVFGIKPEFNECIYCGCKNIVDFSISSGGVICNAHSQLNEKNIIFYNCLKALYYDKDYDESKYLSYDYDSILNGLYNYYLIHLNLKLKEYKL